MPYRTEGTCMGEASLVPYRRAVLLPREAVPSPRQPCHLARVCIHLLDFDTGLCDRTVGIEG